MRAAVERLARALARSATMSVHQRSASPPVDGKPELFAGVRGDKETAARRALIEHLIDAGANIPELEDAVREDRLTTLAIEFALEGEAQYTLTEVARQAKLDGRYLRSVLLSLGHVSP